MEKETVGDVPDGDSDPISDDDEGGDDGGVPVPDVRSDGSSSESSEKPGQGDAPSDCCLDSSWMKDRGSWPSLSSRLSVETLKSTPIMEP